ncbi:Putative 115 kDa protein in type-1 retrotransposable element R1DM [Termitomyces sp. J132]|nr:Putative 115 kDa protein in type-1 retrotransposable element R1DM [Termitomyces sp. J132]
MRVVMMVNKNIATDRWKRLNIESLDVVGISIETEERTVRIFNIYNDCDHSRSVRALDFYLRSAEGRRTRGRNTADIWVGDFNRHHPMWDEPRNAHLFTRRNVDAAEELIAMVTRHRMNMVLRPYVPTLRAKSMKNLTRPDNVFITDSFQSQIVRCEVLHSEQLPKADHFPVITECATMVERREIEGARGEDSELVGSFADDAYMAADGGDMEEAARKVEEMMRREGGASRWAEDHHSIYEVKKFVGMGFSRRKVKGRGDGKAKPATRPTVTIGGTAIRMETSHKFLGVILDQELRFKEHVAYAQGKGTAAAMQTKRLVKVNGGVSGSLARRLYEAVVVPNMLYAADVWCASGVRMEDGTRQKARGFLEKMQRVQRMGALQITGALRTTPTDLLEAHAGIEPMDLRIQRMCVTAAARIAAMPDTHPLRKPAEKAARFVKRHRAPLHYLMKVLGEHPKNMETIEIVQLPPDWECPVTVVLGESKDEAEERERNNRADVRIYTDGSGHHGNIGAAAVLYREGQKAKVMRKRIGGEEKHTVFKGECVGQAMGFELLRREVRGRNRGRRRIRTVTVGTDNQAGMKALEVPGRGTARYIVDEILKGIQKVREIDPSMRIRVYWTPGHAGIPGNERADREAKKAAEGKDTETKGLALLRKPLKASRAAVLATHKKRWREAAREHIRKAPRFDRLRAVDPNAPDMRNILQTLASVPRWHASILTQLRTGHCPLNQYLHRFKKADSPICGACNQAEETVEHFLVHCKAYRTQRNTLFREVDLRTAPMSRLLSDASVVKALFQFINSTGRFRRTYGDLAVPERAVTDKPKGRKRRGRK